MGSWPLCLHKRAERWAEGFSKTSRVPPKWHSFHYQHSSPFTVWAPPCLFSSDLKEIENFVGRRCPFKKEKKKVGDVLFLPLSGHRGEGGIWTASAGNHAEMVWAFVRVRGSTTSFQLQADLCSQGDPR